MAEGVFADVLDKAIQAFHVAGATATFGRQIPALFDAAGLVDVEAVCEVMTFRGGSTGAQMFAASMEQLRPVLLAVGATDDQLEDFHHIMSDPARWFSGFSIYSVRGRVPAV